MTYSNFAPSGPSFMSPLTDTLILWNLLWITAWNEDNLRYLVLCLGTGIILQHLTAMFEIGRCKKRHPLKCYNNVLL